jgi:hypothetical protein
VCFVGGGCLQASRCEVIATLVVFLYLNL